MAETARKLPYDPLPASSSSSSSDEGIREENEKGSNINLVSSSTLNDKGMSLHSFPVESEIFAEKTSLSIQTFPNGGFDATAQSKREMGVSNFFLTIPSCCIRRGDLVVSIFKFEIEPVDVNLSRNSTIISDIPSKKKDLQSRGINKTRREPFCRIENVSAITIKSSAIMSIETFHHEIPPTNRHAESSQNLQKLGEQMRSLQMVFKRVKVSRELKVYATRQEKNCAGFVKIKQFIENASTQTASTRSQNTDYSCDKIESLILESRYVRAAVDMIRQYPFYFDFLERCYTDRNFDQEGKFQHWKPKEKNFKMAVIHAYGYKRSHLKTVNSVLCEFCHVGDHGSLGVE